MTEIQISKLAKQILTTLAFFDAQDMPLTLMEVRNYLISPSLTLPTRLPDGQARGREVMGGVPSLKIREGKGELFISEIQNILETELANRVGFGDGFYFLAGREEIVEARARRYRISLTRFRKARRILYWLRFMPYLRAVAVSGSQALLGSRESSDIDLLIITAKNRIWIARMFVSAFFQIIGQRRHQTYTRNRFCLNHYLDGPRELQSDRNLYTAVEYGSLVPVLGADLISGFQSRNSWIRDYVAAPALPISAGFFGFRFSFFQRFLEAVLEITLAGRLLNQLAAAYQRRRIERIQHIYVSDSELSFHPESKGQRVLARWVLTSRKIGL